MKTQGIVLNEDIAYQATCVQNTDTFELTTTVKVSLSGNTVSPVELDATYRRACDELYGALSRAYGINQTTTAPQSDEKGESGEAEKPESKKAKKVDESQPAK